MNDDIFESVSQGSNGAYDEENRRIQNQFHKEAMERTMKKIVEFKKSPMNSKDFADYMRRNLEMAKQMELASK